MPRSRTESANSIVLLPKMIEGGREIGEEEEEDLIKQMASVLSQLSLYAKVFKMCLVLGV